MKDSDVLTVLLSEDRDEIRNSLKELCMNQIKNDIGDTYLVSADDISELYQELFKELKDELKKELKLEYGEQIKQSILKSITGVLNE